MKIPTLKKALIVAKGRILVNLDAKDNVRKRALGIVKEPGMEDQVLINTTAAPDDGGLEAMGFIGQAHYMPVIREGDIPLS